MTSSLCAVNTLFAPLQRLMRGITQLCAAPARRRAAALTNVLPPPATPVHAAAGAPRRLRVVRILEGSPAASAGRIVISGRMADVCAELERLAAVEAAAGLAPDLSLWA